jgi:glycosyltransferase involved in cell wall biosynthesis
MIKIFYVISSLRRCGPVSQLYNTVKFLDRSGFLPVIVTLSAEGECSMAGEFYDLGVRIETSGFSGPDIVSCLRRVNRLADDIGADIIHSHGVRPDIISSFVRGGVKIFTLRNYPYEDYAMKYGRVRGSFLAACHMRLLKRSANVVSVSRAVARLAGKHGLSTRVIHNGVDTEKFGPVSGPERVELKKKAGLPRDKKVFISAGSMIKRKDPQTAIEGFLKSRVGEKAVLLMAGGGPLLEQLKEKYSERKEIIFAGEVADVGRLFKASDYFISPALSEGLPNSALEAMSCGLPVFLSDIDQHKEISGEGGKAGRIFMAGNPDDLSRVLDIYEDGEYALKREFCRKRVTEDYSARGMSAEYQELYLLLAEAKAGKQNRGRAAWEKK